MIHSASDLVLQGVVPEALVDVVLTPPEVLLVAETTTEEVIAVLARR